MNTSEFKRRVASIPAAGEICEAALEPVSTWFGKRVSNVFVYSSACEYIFERYLNGLGREREWTWYADLSIAEWCECCGDKDAVKNTCANALKHWRSDEKCMAEFACSVAMKAEEHDKRGNRQWCVYYSTLFEYIRDLIYDIYEGDDKKTGYFWRYLD